MKKIITLSFALITVILMYGQTISTETKNAEKLLQQEKYKEAVEELKDAIAIIESEQLSSMNKELLPEKVLDYIKADSEENIELSKSYVSGNLKVLSQVYLKNQAANNTNENATEEYMMELPTQVIISISNVPEKFCEAINIVSANQNSMATTTETIESINFKNYRASIRLDKMAKQGIFMAIVGGATIEIITTGIATNKEVLDIANTIDLEKITQYFGK
jgi:hypothetical protein